MNTVLLRHPPPEGTVLLESLDDFDSCILVAYGGDLPPARLVKLISGEYAFLEVPTSVTAGGPTHGDTAYGLPDPAAVIRRAIEGGHTVVLFDDAGEFFAWYLRQTHAHLILGPVTSGRPLLESEEETCGRFKADRD